MTLIARLACLAVIGVAAVSCSAAPTQQGPANSPKQVVDVSRVKTYHSLRDLVADSDLVVFATATGSKSVQGIGSIPFTTTNMTLNGAPLRGTAPAVVSLRQTGDDQTVTDVGPLVSPGVQYLLFLHRFDFHGPTGEYVVTGEPAGLYRVEGPLALRLDHDSADLPYSIAVAQAPALVRAP